MVQAKIARQSRHRPQHVLVPAQQIEGFFSGLRIALLADNVLRPTYYTITSYSKHVVHMVITCSKYTHNILYIWLLHVHIMFTTCSPAFELTTKGFCRQTRLIRIPFRWYLTHSPVKSSFLLAATTTAQTKTPKHSNHNSNMFSKYV